jgi:hypothetical protein
MDVGREGVEHAGQPALEVEHALGEHQATDQVGPLLRDQEADRSADRVADQVDWLVDDSLDERDRVVGHLRKGDRAADVGCSALTAPVEAVRAKGGGEAVEVAVVGARVGAAGVQQHERFAVAVDVPPGVDVGELGVGGHAGPLSRRVVGGDEQDHRNAWNSSVVAADERHTTAVAPARQAALVGTPVLGPGIAEPERERSSAAEASVATRSASPSLCGTAPQSGCSASFHAAARGDRWRCSCCSYVKKLIV